MYRKSLLRMMDQRTTALLMIVTVTLTHYNVILAAPASSSLSSSSPSQIDESESQDKPFQNAYLDNIDAESKIAPYMYNVEPKETNEVEDSKALPERLKSIMRIYQRAGASKNWMLRQAIQDRQHKRQIRYQQCYFNPISCF